MHNLLSDPIIGVTDGNGVKHALTLPGVLAAIGRRDLRQFNALRPHQRHAWHMFLAQLGAFAMLSACETDLPEDESTWAAMLRALTADWPDDAPWHLVEADLTKPAFLQIPIPEGRLEVLKNTVETPDALDILIKSRNHDVKMAVMTGATPEDWLHAVVDLQTMEQYSGAGNYGISRMNGGSSGRPFLGLASQADPGHHVAEDMKRLLDALPDIRREYGQLFTSNSGHCLTWLLPWDGTTSLTFGQLHPFYLDCCRRVRLTGHSGRITARVGTSKVPRIDARALNGVTGDPWVPVHRTQNKSLSLTAKGFTYHRLNDYLFSGDWRLPVSLESPPTDARLLVARGVARGNCTTDGYFERIVPLTRKAFSMFGKAEDGREVLARLSKERIGEIGALTKLLRTSIAMVAAGGPEDLSSLKKEHRATADPYVQRLEALIDAEYFDALWQEVEEDGDDARTVERARWINRLISQARALLVEATDRVPCKSIHRHRARVRAEGLFASLIRKNFDAYLPQREVAS